MASMVKGIVTWPIKCILITKVSFILIDIMNAKHSYKSNKIDKKNEWIK